MSLAPIKYKIDRCSLEQKKELEIYIKNSYHIFDEYSSCESCPICHSKRICKNGLRKSVQKYLCRSCGKNFNYKTNTVLSGIHLEKLKKWNLFVEDFLSLNITPLKLLKKKLGVSEQTVFNWRHKLLAAVSTYTKCKFKDEKIELDEAWFRISRKGRRNLGIKDKSKYRSWRKKQVGDSDYNVKLFFSFGRGSRLLDVHTSHTGRTSAAHMERYFTKDVFDWKSITVYSDSHYTYKGFFKKNNIQHETFIGKNHINYSNKEVHNQTINAFVRGFKYFVNEHLRGVSSKYIGLYASWFQFLNQCKVEAFKKEELRFNVTDEICENIVEDKIGLELYRQTEVSFARFLKENGRTNFGDCKHHYYANKMAA